jgi:HK97 family phage prohead protease
MPDTIERKAFQAFDVKADPETGVLEAIVSVFGNVDNGGEIVEPGFFKDSLGERMPKGVWMHDWKTPVAKTLEAKELLPGDPLLPPALQDNGGAYVKAQFNLDTQRGREAFSDIKFGLVDEYSIGYKVLEDTWEAKADANGSPRQVRRLLKGRWYEWSPVLVGMNDRTATIGVKEDDSGEPEPLALSDEVFHFEEDDASTGSGHAEQPAAKASANEIAVGDWVRFDQGRREIRGRVVERSVQGTIEGTGVSGTDDDPALRIQIYVQSAADGGWQATNRFIGKLISEVTKISLRVDSGRTTDPDPIPTPNVIQPLPAVVERLVDPPTAGQFVNAKADGNSGDPAEDPSEPADDGLSFEQVTERVSRAINRSAMSLGGGYVYVIATYPGAVIVRRYDGEGSDNRYFRVDYSLDGNGAVSLGEAEEVRQTYAPVKADRAGLAEMQALLDGANEAMAEAGSDIKEGRTVSTSTYNCLAKASAGIRQADGEIGRLLAMAAPKRKDKKRLLGDPQGADPNDPGEQYKTAAARRLRALALDIDLAASSDQEHDRAVAG